MKYLWLIIILPAALYAEEGFDTSAADANISVEIVTDVGGIEPDGGVIGDGQPSSEDPGLVNYE